MDSFQSDFEYLCRVCAANTKGKYSVPECMDILKTPGLKQKVEKHLYLGISETDALPKVLCKTCFRQVEATASLSKIAKHTQKVFRDFLLSAGKQFLGINYENQQPDSTPEHSTIEMDAPFQTKSNNNSSRTSASSKKSNITLADMFVPPALVPFTPVTPVTEAVRREEVVLNVSVSDPLTRDTQQKMISASQKRQLSTLGVDTSFTPGSIAQRAFSPMPKATASEGTLNKTPSSRSTANKNSNKYSPPGVINFFHNRSLTAPTISTTLTSNKNHENKLKQKLQKIQVPVSISNNEKTVDNELLPKTDAAQQLYHKRKQTKMPTAVNQTANQQQHQRTSSTKSTKQISLLKVTQQKQQEQLQQLQLMPANTSHVASASTSAVAVAPAVITPAAATTIITVKSHESLTKFPNTEYEQEEEEEQLPQRMIIAAAKSEKQQKQQKSTSAPIKPAKTVIVPIVTKSIENISMANANNNSNASVETIQSQQSLSQAQVQQQQQQQQPQSQQQPATTSFFGTSTNFDDNILLGKVIRDVDLLKLIIKALQWPVNDTTMDMHLMRLRNSRFLEVMSDPNLLQDTDLTQILGPIIFAAQHLQQQQQNEMQQKQNELKQREELQKQFEQQLKQKQQLQQQQQERQQQQLLAAAALEQQQKLQQQEQQQQQQLEQEQLLALKYKNEIENNNNNNSNGNNMKTQVMDLATTLTYKLPAETSVQLVPASPETEEPQSSASSCSGISSNNDFKCDNVRIMPIKKQKRKIEQILSHPVVIAVDDDDYNNSNDDDTDKSIKNIKNKRRHNKSTKNNFIFEDNTNNNFNNNLNNNSDDSIFDTDDIVLMEDQPHLETIKSLVNTGVIVEATPSIGSRSPNKHVTFAEPLTPPITRPIIKRRKTVIQATKLLPASIVKKPLSNVTIAASNADPNNKEKEHHVMPTVECEVAEIIENIVNTKVLSNTSIQLSIGTQVPSDMELPSIEHAPRVFLTAVASDVITPTTSSKSQHNLSTAGNGSNNNNNKRDQKLALGQQLLQAIGLQQQTDESSSSSKEKKTDSVAQIRSALKRSLKQAQEQQQKQQQQQRNNAKEEPIIQDADSTTRHNNNNNKHAEKDHKQGPLAVTATEEEDKLLTKAVKRKNSTTPLDEDSNKMTSTTTAENMQKKNDLNKLPSSVIDLNDVTSTAENVSGRKRGRKSKSEIRDVKVTKTEQSEDDDVRSDVTIESLSNRRPTRMSKTLSKYYKGPEQNSDSRRSLPARSTRNSK